MNIKKNEQGIALVGEIIALAIVIAIVAFVGFTVLKSDKDKEPTTTQASTTDGKSPAENSEGTWKEVDYAVKGKYADADVVQVNDKTWRLYYAVQPEVQGNNFEVYSAKSTDGKTWKQEAGTRKTMATFPEVIKLKDGKFRMYYQSAGVIKSAISSDGLSFKDESGTRIDKVNSEGLTLDNVAAPTITQQDNGTFVLVYRGTTNKRYAANTPNPSTQVLFWATSSDGLSFKKKGLAIDSRNSTLDGQLDGPDIVKWDDNSYRVFATSYTGVYSFTFDGSKFGKPELALSGGAVQDNMGFRGAPPGDPTLTKIKGIWYMYYGATGTESGIHYATLQ